MTDSHFLGFLCFHISPFARRDHHPSIISSRLIRPGRCPCCIQDIIIHSQSLNTKAPLHFAFETEEPKMTRFTPAIGARIFLGLLLMTTSHAFVMKTQFGRSVHDGGALHMSTDASSLPTLEQVRAISDLLFCGVRLFFVF